MNIISFMLIAACLGDNNFSTHISNSHKSERNLFQFINEVVKNINNKLFLSLSLRTNFTESAQYKTLVTMYENFKKLVENNMLIYKEVIKESKLSTCTITIQNLTEVISSIMEEYIHNKTLTVKSNNINITHIRKFKDLLKPNFEIYHSDVAEEADFEENISLEFIDAFSAKINNLTAKDFTGRNELHEENVHNLENNINFKDFNSVILNARHDLRVYSNTRRNRRLFTGHRASIKLFPFIVSLHFKDKFLCSGSLISKDSVLTSASCLEKPYYNRSYQLNYLTVRAGSPFNDKEGTVVPVAHIYLHPLYREKYLSNNLAIAKLQTSLDKMNQEIQKVEYDKEKSVISTGEITVLGWGLHNLIDVNRRRKLSLAVHEILDGELCRMVYGIEYVSNFSLCSSNPNPEKGTCTDDTGGPALINGILVGVVSFGPKTCGDPSALTVYTQIGFHSDWIEYVIRKQIRVQDIQLKVNTTATATPAPTIASRIVSLVSAKPMSIRIMNNLFANVMLLLKLMKSESFETDNLFKDMADLNETMKAYKNHTVLWMKNVMPELSKTLEKIVLKLNNKPGKASVLQGSDEARAALETLIKPKTFLSVLNILEKSTREKDKTRRSESVQKLNGSLRKEILSAEQYLNELAYFEESNKNGSEHHGPLFPFIASFHLLSEMLCVGSIISTDMVVTAASCLIDPINSKEYKKNQNVLTVRIGSDYCNRLGELIPVVKVYIHPQFDTNTLSNNIAIAKFRRQHIFRKRNKIIKVIEYDTKNILSRSLNVIVVGWSDQTNVGGEDKGQLSTALLNLFDIKKCILKYTSAKITEKNFCARLPKHNTKECKRHVGGPAIVGSTLVGIVSSNPPNDSHHNRLTIFVKVYEYHDWIQNILTKAAATDIAITDKTTKKEKHLENELVISDDNQEGDGYFSRKQTSNTPPLIMRSYNLTTTKQYLKSEKSITELDKVIENNQPFTTKITEIEKVFKAHIESKDVSKTDQPFTKKNVKNKKENQSPPTKKHQTSTAKYVINLKHNSPFTNNKKNKKRATITAKNVKNKIHTTSTTTSELIEEIEKFDNEPDIESPDEKLITNKNVVAKYLSDFKNKVLSFFRRKAKPAIKENVMTQAT